MEQVNPIVRRKLRDVLHGIKQRCTNPNHPLYKWYGARGIKVCIEWQKDSELFIQWAISNGYAVGLTIDRIDNNGSYTPDNCRWVTNLENQRNKRNNVLIDGMALSKYCELHGLVYASVKDRRKRYKETARQAVDYYLDNGIGVRDLQGGTDNDTRTNRT